MLHSMRELKARNRSLRQWPNVLSEEVKQWPSSWKTSLQFQVQVGLLEALLGNRLLQPSKPLGDGNCEGPGPAAEGDAEMASAAGPETIRSDAEALEEENPEMQEAIWVSRQQSATAW